MTPEGQFIHETYAHDGFVFPIDAISESEARSIRDDLKAAEAELADDPEKLMLLRSYPDRLLPSFDKLIRNPNLIAAVSPMLGTNLMVWNSGLFIKEANTSKVVTWHQDLNYWGLDEVNEITALGSAVILRRCERLHAVRARHSHPSDRTACRYLRREQPAVARSGNCR